MVGNPDPNLKSVHMGMHHPGYTQHDYDMHFDWDCTFYRVEPIYAGDYIVAYKRINIKTNKID